jgi:hypothetical protein
VPTSHPAVARSPRSENSVELSYLRDRGRDSRGRDEPRDDLRCDDRRGEVRWSGRALGRKFGACQLDRLDARRDLPVGEPGQQKSGSWRTGWKPNIGCRKSPIERGPTHSPIIRSRAQPTSGIPVHHIAAAFCLCDTTHVPRRRSGARWVRSASFRVGANAQCACCATAAYRHAATMTNVWESRGVVGSLQDGAVQRFVEIAITLLRES